MANLYFVFFNDACNFLLAFPNPITKFLKSITLSTFPFPSVQDHRDEKDRLRLDLEYRLLYLSCEVSLEPCRCNCKHKISQLQKIKQLKRNMICKYKFVLMYNEYNLYFDSFTKEYPLILLQKNIFFEFDSNKKSSWLWLEDGLNDLHNKSLALSLLEICYSSSLRTWRLLGWSSSGL